MFIIMFVLFFGEVSVFFKKKKDVFKTYPKTPAIVLHLFVTLLKSFSLCCAFLLPEGILQYSIVLYVCFFFLLHQVTKCMFCFFYSLESFRIEFFFSQNEFICFAKTFSLSLLKDCLNWNIM